MRWPMTRSLTLDFNAVNNARVDEPFGRIDTKVEKDSVKKNLFRGGRNTHYHHDVTVNYTLPTSKLPFLDWTNMNLSYTGKYDWVAASLLTRNLGNTLLNGQTRNATADLNFDQLYNKFKLLRAINMDGPLQKPTTPKYYTDSTGKRRKLKDPNRLPFVSGIPRAFGRILTSVKQINVQYNEDLGTLLPGYMDSTRFIGMNWRSRNPGLGYLFGYQPDTADINLLGSRGLLSRDQLFNSLIQQRYNQRISLTARVSPVRDLNINLNLDKTFDKQYSELYKDTTGTSGLARLNPYAMGSFSMSYISYKTLFGKFDPNEVSETFREFEANRVVLSQRLKNANPYAQGNPQNAEGYYQGYGRYAQDVLIPAFIAAYTGKDPQSVALIKSSNSDLRSNPFSGYIPKPNWTIDYNGLSRLKGLDKVFTNFSIRHGYNSSLSMNSFTTALLFQDRFRRGYPEFIDTTTGNYIPYFLVPNISIGEQFAPLLGVDLSFRNDLSVNFEYKKSRQLSLSLIDYQLAENRSTEYTFGLNWRKRGVPFLQNIRFGRNGRKLDNDMTLRLDFSLRDDAQANTRLDQQTAYPAAGQKVMRIAPSLDYVISQRVQLKFYFEQNRMEPKIATSAPVVNTRAGAQVRISLAQ